jgi:sulfur-oxidizing protein SoxZ
MKNIWFVVIGIFVGAFTLLILTDTFHLNTFIQKENRSDIQKKAIKKTLKHPQKTKILQDIQNTQNDTSASTEDNIHDSNLSTDTLPENMNESEDTDIEEIYKEEMQENAQENTTIRTKQPIPKRQPISMANAKEFGIKIKAKEKAGIVKAKVQIKHDMLTYTQAKKKGKQTHFITHITARVDQRVVYDASISQFLSKDPLIRFSFKGKKGEILTVLYWQLTGEVFYASKKIK